MSIKIIQSRLETYACQNWQAEEQALKEICQELTLSALSRTDFFQVAAFHGGTALRIIYGLNRFSEDLDFVLQNPAKAFNWDKYLQALSSEFSAYGMDLTIQDRSKVDSAVKQAFLKDQSLGKLLKLKNLPQDQKIKSLRIKFEIDTRPPRGSRFEIKYLDWPLPVALTLQDRPSLLAGKSHALLCRSYTKGRDWYDFLWYVQNQTVLNFELLSGALNQIGPWQDQKVQVDRFWYQENVGKKIESLDWKKAKQDVSRFLSPREQEGLELWGQDFFLDRLVKLTSKW